MKKIITLVLIVLSGCNSLRNPQVQPVIRKNIKEEGFFTTCSGLAEGWGSCFNKAKITCTNGYIEVGREQDSSGTHRSFTFKCK